MIKHSMRLTGFILAIFTSILIFQNEIVNQQQFPLDTEERFEINISNSILSKEEMIKQLNTLIDNSGGTLVKVVTDSENYENKKDIVWFGSKEPNSNKLIIDKNEKKFYGLNLNWMEN